MLPSRDPEKEALSQKIKADTEAYLASGKEIKIIPYAVTTVVGVLDNLGEKETTLARARKKATASSVRNRKRAST